VPYNAIMPGDQLLLRPTVIGGDAAPDDYQVIWNGMPIGRILEQPGVLLGRPNWFWGVAFPGRSQPSGHRGNCSDLENDGSGRYEPESRRSHRGRHRGGTGISWLPPIGGPRTSRGADPPAGKATQARFRWRTSGSTRLQLMA
jgi:hypothetical protein